MHMSSHKHHSVSLTMLHWAATCVAVISTSMNLLGCTQTPPGHRNTCYAKDFYHKHETLVHRLECHVTLCLSWVYLYSVYNVHHVSKCLDWVDIRKLIFESGYCPYRLHGWPIQELKYRVPCLAIWRGQSFRDNGDGTDPVYCCGIDR